MCIGCTLDKHWKPMLWFIDHEFPAGSYIEKDKYFIEQINRAKALMLKNNIDKFEAIKELFIEHHIREEGKVYDIHEQRFPKRKSNNTKEN